MQFALLPYYNAHLQGEMNGTNTIKNKKSNNNANKDYGDIDEEDREECGRASSISSSKRKKGKVFDIRRDVAKANQNMAGDKEGSNEPLVKLDIVDEKRESQDNIIATEGGMAGTGYPMLSMDNGKYTKTPVV